jgi:hypothetical protein
MESNAAEELAALERLKVTARRETARSPRWLLPLMVVSGVVLFFAYSVEIPGVAQVGWLVWIVYVWGVVVLARRHNRVRASRGEVLGRLAVTVGLVGGSFLVAAVTTRWAGAVAGGVAGVTLIALARRDAGR